MPITDWESSGIDWEKPQLASFYDVLESIRLAVNERCNVLGLGDRGSYKIGGFCRLSRLLNVTRRIQDSVYGLLPFFANHTINSGNFDGLGDIPRWTLEDALIYINDEENENPYQRGAIISVNWIKRMYKLLNLMRWRFCTLTSYTMTPVS